VNFRLFQVHEALDKDRKTDDRTKSDQNQYDIPVRIVLEDASQTLIDSHNICPIFLLPLKTRDPLWKPSPAIDGAPSQRVPEIRKFPRADTWRATAPKKRRRS